MENDSDNKINKLKREPTKEVDQEFFDSAFQLNSDNNKNEENLSESDGEVKIGILEKTLGDD